MEHESARGSRGMRFQDTASRLGDGRSRCGRVFTLSGFSLFALGSKNQGRHMRSIERVAVLLWAGVWCTRVCNRKAETWNVAAVSSKQLHCLQVGWPHMPELVARYTLEDMMWLH
jgi:hypothetical protein